MATQTLLVLSAEQLMFGLDELGKSSITAAPWQQEMALIARQIHEAATAKLEGITDETGRLAIARTASMMYEQKIEPVKAAHADDWKIEEEEKYAKRRENHIRLYGSCPADMHIPPYRSIQTESAKPALTV